MSIHFQSRTFLGFKIDFFCSTSFRGLGDFRTTPIFPKNKRFAKKFVKIEFDKKNFASIIMLPKQIFKIFR